MGRILNSQVRDFSCSEQHRSINSIADAVKVVIDSYQTGQQFFGNQLKDDAVELYPESAYAYVDTFLRAARRHRRDSFRVADQNRSLYVRTKSILEEMNEKRIKAENEAARKRKENFQNNCEQYCFNFT